MDRRAFSPPHLLEHFPVPNFHWGLRQDNLVFLAGQAGIEQDGSVPDGMEDQSRVALESITETLTGLDAQPSDIVQMNIFFKLKPASTLMEALTEFVQAKDKLMPDCVPVGLAVPVPELFHPEVNCEVQVIAMTS
jgi:enamine deaminase RidA (YjgF/YER057c/UK114 family)